MRICTHTGGNLGATKWDKTSSRKICGVTGAQRAQRVHRLQWRGLTRGVSQPGASVDLGDLGRLFSISQTFCAPCRGHLSAGVVQYDASAFPFCNWGSAAALLPNNSSLTMGRTLSGPSLDGQWDFCACLGGKIRSVMGRPRSRRPLRKRLSRLKFRTRSVCRNDSPTGHG